MDIFNKYEDFSKLIRDITYGKEEASKLEAFIITSPENIVNIGNMIEDYITNLGFTFTPKDKENKFEGIFGQFFKDLSFKGENSIHFVEDAGLTDNSYTILIKYTDKENKVTTNFISKTNAR